MTFRTLDIGGDKVLPYMRNIEKKPALGWRAIASAWTGPALRVRCARYCAQAGAVSS